MRFIPEIILLLGFVSLTVGAVLSYELGTVFLIDGGYLTAVAVLMALTRA